MSQKLPFISVIIPCFNEADFIDKVLQDILAQSYPQALTEVFFLDGMSTDATPQIISGYAEKFPFIHLLPNPAQYVPQAMNKGINLSKGDIIIRLDAHAAYPKDYFEKLVKWSLKTDANNVGGVWNTKPVDKSTIAQTNAILLSHPLGVGNASFRLGVSEPQEADTVPFGCFKKETFDKYGLYDERLHRNQDIELNKRITAGGGKVLLVPDVTCDYFARGTYSSLWNNNHANGKWVILTAYFTKTFGSLSLRHFVPLGFVLYFALVFTLATSQLIFSSLPAFLSILYLPAALYFLLIASASIRVGFERKNVAFIPALFFGFLVLHFSYGLGSIAGIFSVLFQKKNK